MSRLVDSNKKLKKTGEALKLKVAQSGLGDSSPDKKKTCGAGQETRSGEGSNYDQLLCLVGQPVLIVCAVLDGQVTLKYTGDLVTYCNEHVAIEDAHGQITVIRMPHVVSVQGYPDPRLINDRASGDSSPDNKSEA